MTPRGTEAAYDLILLSITHSGSSHLTNKMPLSCLGWSCRDSSANSRAFCSSFCISSWPSSAERSRSQYQRSRFVEWVTSIHFKTRTGLQFIVKTTDSLLQCSKEDIYCGWKSLSDNEHLSSWEYCKTRNFYEQFTFAIFASRSLSWKFLAWKVYFSY